LVANQWTSSFLSDQEFCSVGDDSCLILWDARIGNEPALKVYMSYVVNKLTAVHNLSVNKDGVTLVAFFDHCIGCVINVTNCFHLLT
jgi:hypothetical protein